MKLIPVQATPGLKVPKEGDPRNYITDAKPVQVPDTHFYRKAIADGDLIELPAGEWEKFKATRDSAEAEATIAAQAQADKAAKVAKTTAKPAQ